MCGDEKPTTCEQQKMGVGENSALDIEAVSLPVGISAKSLLTTAPYNAKNPQTNQVTFVRYIILCAAAAGHPSVRNADMWRLVFAHRPSTVMPSTTSFSGAPSSRARIMMLARRSGGSSCPSAPRSGYVHPLPVTTSSSRALLMTFYHLPPCSPPPSLPFLSISVDQVSCAFLLAFVTGWQVGRTARVGFLPWPLVNN